MRRIYVLISATLLLNCTNEPRPESDLATDRRNEILVTFPVSEAFLSTVADCDFPK